MSMLLIISLGIFISIWTRFIREDTDNDESVWEKRLAKKYYDKLFKEYCLADMTRYKEGKVCMDLSVFSLYFCPPI